MAKQALGLKLPLRLGKDGYFETNTATADQVSDNIKNLLLTKPGERRFNNEFGSSIYKLLFEQRDMEVTKNVIVDTIQRDIDKFLNGVIVNDVKVNISPNQPENKDENSIYIGVNFTYNQINGIAEIEITNNNI